MRVSRASAVTTMLASAAICAGPLVGVAAAAPVLVQASPADGAVITDPAHLPEYVLELLRVQIPDRNQLLNVAALGSVTANFRDLCNHGRRAAVPGPARPALPRLRPVLEHHPVSERQRSTHKLATWRSS